MEIERKRVEKHGKIGQGGKPKIDPFNVQKFRLFHANGNDGYIFLTAATADDDDEDDEDDNVEY